MQKVKICGITKESELDKLIELKVDYAGFVVFFPKSRRNNEIEHAAELVKYIKEKKKIQLKAVAVTVSPDLKQLKEIEAAGFDILQVHGELYDEVREKSELPIWRAFNLTSYNDEDINTRLKKLVSDDKISGIVFDSAAYGSGKAFDWDSFKNINSGDKLFILAGGLTPDNVTQAVKKLKPDIVDVSSGVEYDDKTIQGKDLKKTERFVREARGGFP